MQLHVMNSLSHPKRMRLRTSTLGYLAVFLAIFSGRALLANDADEAELRAAIDECRSKFPAESAAIFDAAQTAWDSFRSANLIATKGKLGNEQGDRLNEMDRLCLLARAVQLRKLHEPMLGNRDAMIKKAQSADQDLCQIFKECTELAPGNNRHDLCEAQRKWIAYREANAKAAYLAVPGNEAIATTIAATELRQTELMGTYEGYTKKAAEAVAQISQELKLIKDMGPLKMKLQALEAKAKAASANIPAPLAVTNISAFPSEVTQEALSIGATIDEFKPLENSIFAEVRPQIMTVYTIISLSKAKEQVNSGDAPSAARIIASHNDILKNYPGLNSIPGGTYFSALAALFETSQRQGLEHEKKAAAAAALGRTSEAIREYKAAYDLFPDPSVAEKTKKLREESLGL